MHKTEVSAGILFFHLIGFVVKYIYNKRNALEERLIMTGHICLDFIACLSNSL